MKGDIKTILKTEKEAGIVAGLKKAGCYTLGVLETIAVPAYYTDGVICKGIGLAFDKDSFVNEMGNLCLGIHNIIPKFFAELPESVSDTKITGSETHYDLFDLEIPYYSNGEVGPYKIFNIRHQIISN